MYVHVRLLSNIIIIQVVESQLCPNGVRSKVVAHDRPCWFNICSLTTDFAIYHVLQGRVQPSLQRHMPSMTHTPCNSHQSCTTYLFAITYIPIGLLLIPILPYMAVLGNLIFAALNKLLLFFNCLAQQSVAQHIGL